MDGSDYRLITCDGAGTAGAQDELKKTRKSSRAEIAMLASEVQQLKQWLAAEREKRWDGVGPSSKEKSGA